MAQLWGGRFTKATDDEVFAFNASLSFDQRLFEQDIEGSIAHVVMLEKQGVISLAEKDDIVRKWDEILSISIEDLDYKRKVLAQWAALLLESKGKNHVVINCLRVKLLEQTGHAMEFSLKEDGTLNI